MPPPEDKARENINLLLAQAGWAVRDQSDANILAYLGGAIRNFTFKQRHTGNSKHKSLHRLGFG